MKGCCWQQIVDTVELSRNFHLIAWLQHLIFDFYVEQKCKDKDSKYKVLTIMFKLRQINSSASSLSLYIYIYNSCILLVLSIDYYFLISSIYYRIPMSLYMDYMISTPSILSIAMQSAFFAYTIVLYLIEQSRLTL
jgi:hypothetical protein